MTSKQILGAEILRAPIAVSTSGANALVAANSSKKIVVVNYNLMAAAAVNVKFQSGSTDLTGLKYPAANGGLSADGGQFGCFETAVNEALNINLSGNVAVGGELSYVLI